MLVARFLASARRARGGASLRDKAWRLLYTANGAAALLVALCDVLLSQSGSWTPVFAIMVAADAIAALLALFVLRPCERGWRR
jgi:hypothetical protein